MQLSRWQRWLLYACAGALVILGGWSVSTSYTTTGGLTAFAVNAFLTKIAVAAGLYVLAVAARFTRKR